MLISESQRILIVEWARSIQTVKKVWLYGSRARGTARADSDVDLAIECEFEDYCFSRKEWETDLSARTGIKVHIQTPTDDDEIVKPAVKKHGILIYQSEESSSWIVGYK